MRSIVLLIIATFCFAGDGSAQNTKYAAIDKKMLQIPDSLTTNTDGIALYISTYFAQPEDCIRAAFIWIARNIQYDIENIFAIDFYEKQEEKIAKVLKNRKGICENYSALIKDINNKNGIATYIIEDYTRQNRVYRL